MQAGADLDAAAAVFFPFCFLRVLLPARATGPLGLPVVLGDGRRAGLGALGGRDMVGE